MRETKKRRPNSSALATLQHILLLAPPLSTPSQCTPKPTPHFLLSRVQMASGMRECAACGRILPRSSYTANQYAKGAGLSRCASCVHGHHSDAPSAAPSDSGRYNISYSSTVTYDALENPFAQGAFRWVAKGTYTDGPRYGEACVVKWFKTGAVFEADYFALDIKAVNKALELANLFNELRVVDKSVKVNVAAVWKFTDNVAADWAGRMVLCEPFIQNYQKFNSNTGWNDDSRVWGEVMQALSHFSYHVTGGQFVLCDLQGGIYQREVVLSDPVILSRRRDYGVTDLGPDGISSFFSHHTCNRFCRPNWAKPWNPVARYDPVPGTTMIRNTVPTAYSRPRFR
ncbi:kinase-like domain-containing protein [Durotheca rogersii]|uniref:kinase-like domain-containing protein n=1 Tax=Durotheca rogersii TaxID=419775 RepID=UPI0022204DF0|nr:kinase-like domain-containing protein [Durotheca rogersii]KAI5863733.1 kinase-like domain-containing protein [Durotheca rogersii]